MQRNANDCILQSYSPRPAEPLRDRFAGMICVATTCESRQLALSRRIDGNQMNLFRSLDSSTKPTAVVAVGPATAWFDSGSSCHSKFHNGLVWLIPLSPSTAA